MRAILFLAAVAIAALSHAQQQHAIPLGDSPGLLHEFVQRGDAAGVRAMASRGYDMKRGFEPPLLVVATKKGDDEVVAALLDGGADPNAKDNDTRSAIVYAARDGRTRIAQMLLAKGADPNARNDYPRVFFKLEGRSPHLYFDNHKTALMYAAQGGHTAIVEALVARGAKVNAQAYYDETALMFAAGDGRTPTVVRLLELGADLHAAARSSAREREAQAFGASYGGTALQYAVRGKHGETARGLLEKYGRHSIEDPKEVYYYALFADDVPLMQALSARGLGPPDDVALTAAAEGASPAVLDFVVAQRIRAGKPLPPAILASAGASGSLEKVKALVDRGADVNARDNLGHGALYYAVKKGQRDVVAYLLDRGAAANVAGRNLGYSGMGETPLALAVQQGDLAIAKMLLAKGADPRFKASGMSPLEVAQRLGRSDMLMLMTPTADGKQTYHESGPVAFGAQFRSGGLLYRTMCGCHGREVGGAYATFAGGRIEGFVLKRTPREAAIAAVMFGLKRPGKIPMGEFSSQLLDAEAAAILSYLDSALGGTTEAAYQPADIAAVRKAPAMRAQEPLIGADPSARDAVRQLEQLGYLYSESVFVEAVRARDRQAVDLFLAAGMSPTARNALGHTALFVAVSTDNVDAIKALADRGAKFDLANSPWANGAPAAAGAVEHCDGRSAALRYMLDRGLDANFSYGLIPQTLLMNAAGNRCVEAVRLLVNRGADVNKRFPNGRTAYEVAKTSGDGATMQVLLDAGAHR